MRIKSEMSDEIIDLSMVPDLAERRRVLRALKDFDAVSERQSQATKALWDTKHKLEAAQQKLEREIECIQQTFYGEYDAIDGYPDIDSPYRMHDDHLGCDICEISGLPLRDEDETVEWGDGEALACLAKNAR